MFASQNEDILITLTYYMQIMGITSLLCLTYKVKMLVT